MKKWVVILALAILTLTVIPQHTSATEVHPVIRENFNYLNKSFWNAENYSYYGIWNGYLYPTELPSGRTISDTYALKHNQRINFNSVYLEEKIRIMENNSNNVHNEYNFFMIYTLSDWDIFEVQFRGSTLYLKLSTDGGNSYRNLYSISASQDNYTVSAKFSNQYIYYKLVSSAGVLKEGSNRLHSSPQYANFEIYWFWEQNHMWDNPEPNRYNVYVDEIYMTSYQDAYAQSIKNGQQTDYSVLIEQNSTTIALWTIIAFFVVGLLTTGDVRTFLILTGIILATISFIVSMSVFQTNIFTEIFASIGASVFFITIWNYAKKEENIFTNWGLEFSLFFTGLAFIGGEILAVL